MKPNPPSRLTVISPAPVTFDGKNYRDKRVPHGESVILNFVINAMNAIGSPVPEQKLRSVASDPEDSSHARATTLKRGILAGKRVTDRTG